MSPQRVLFILLRQRIMFCGGMLTSHTHRGEESLSCKSETAMVKLSFKLSPKMQNFLKSKSDPRSEYWPTVEIWTESAPQQTSHATPQGKQVKGEISGCDEHDNSKRMEERKRIVSGEALESNHVVSYWCQPHSINMARGTIKMILKKIQNFPFIIPLRTHSKCWLISITW